MIIDRTVLNNDIARAKEYCAESIEEGIVDNRNGINTNFGIALTVSIIVKAIEFYLSYSTDLNNLLIKQLYYDLLLLIGDFNPGAQPTVTVGPNITIIRPVNSAVLNATVTNATRVLWTQVSGPSTAVIASPTAASTAINALNSLGTYTFKITAYNGFKSASYITSIEVKDSPADVYLITSTSSTILPDMFNSAQKITVAKGSNYTFKFAIDPTTPIYYCIAEPVSEPTKVSWEDTIDDLNKGNIGTISDLFGQPRSISFNGKQYRAYVTNYETFLRSTYRLVKGSTPTSKYVEDGYLQDGYIS